MVKEDVMIDSVKSSREIKKTGYLSGAYNVYEVVIKVDKIKIEVTWDTFNMFHFQALEPN